MKLKSKNALNSIAIKRLIKKYKYIFANKCDNLNVIKNFLKNSSFQNRSENRVSEQLKNLKL